MTRKNRIISICAERVRRTRPQNIEMIRKIDVTTYGHREGYQTDECKTEYPSAIDDADHGHGADSNRLPGDGHTGRRRQFK